METPIEVRRVVRPSVGMWSHTRNKWYAVDMHGNAELFETAGQADHRALTNFHDYAEYLEEQIQEWLLKAGVR